MPKMTAAAIDVRAIPADMLARLRVLLAEHVADAATPREGVIAAAKAAKAEALRNGWAVPVAHALGELVASLGGDMIGHATLAADAEAALKAARADERRAETWHRRAVETGESAEVVDRHAVRVAKARTARERAEADFAKATGGE